MNIKTLILVLSLVLISQKSWGGPLEHFVFENVSEGRDFCSKLEGMLKGLSKQKITTLVKLNCTVEVDNIFSNDIVFADIKVNHQRCNEEEAAEEKYFRIVKLYHEGIYYTEEIKEVLERLGFKFIAQTEDSSITSEANGGDFQLVIGIPRCQEVN